MRPPPPVDQVPASDGTPLAVHSIPGGSGTPLLLCKGVGGTVTSWGGVIDHIVEDRTVVTWDNRGLGASGPPRRREFGPEVQAEDGLAVADAVGLDEFLVAGWSTGARIALEIAGSAPARVGAVALVCGGNGHHVARALTHLEIGSVLPLLAGGLKFFHGTLAGPLRATLARPEVAGVVRQSGILAATADTSAIVELFRSIASSDLGTVLASYEAVAGDNDPALPRRVTAPALVIGGAKDVFVTRTLLEDLVEALPRARLVIYDRASHYLLLEHPQRLGRDLKDFFSSPGL